MHLPFSARRRTAPADIVPIGLAEESATGAASLITKSRNRKLSPVLLEPTSGRPRPVARPPFVSVTYASIERTATDGSVGLMPPAERAGGGRGDGNGKAGGESVAGLAGRAVVDGALVQEHATAGNKSVEGTPIANIEVALFTVQRVAAILSISTRTVRRLLRRGDLVAHRLSKSIVRVGAESVTQLLEATRGVPSLESSWQKENASTSVERPTSPDSAAQQNSGPRSSTGAKSPSKRRTAPRLNDDSSLSPLSAAELKEMVRRLRRPN